MKKEHSSRWRKLDNAAQAFPAATGKKDTRVFRFYCQLKEDIQADLLQKALEQTMEHYPVFSMVLRKGLFWFYLEQRDLPAKVEEEKRPPCSEIYVPDHKTLLFQVSYYKTRINFEVFHALTDGTGAMLFLKELVSNYLILCHPEEIFSKVSEDMLTETDFEEDSFSQYYTGKKSEKEKSRPAYQIKGEYLEQEEMEVTEILLSAEAVHKCAKAHGVSVTAYLAAALVYAVYEEIPKSRLKKPVSLMVPANLRNFFPSASMTNFWSWIEIACDLGPEASFEDALQITGAAMQKEALKQEISTRMNDLVRIERNPVLRAVPLYREIYSPERNVVQALADRIEPGDIVVSENINVFGPLMMTADAGDYYFYNPGWWQVDVAYEAFAPALRGCVHDLSEIGTLGGRVWIIGENGRCDIYDGLQAAFGGLREVGRGEVYQPYHALDFDWTLYEVDPPQA